MAKNVDVNVNVQDNAEESIARLRELRNEIRNVAVGSDDFRKLRQEMDDIEDSLKAGRTAAGNFADVLGTVPGPIGDIGSQAASTIDTLKGLGKLKFGDLMSSFTSLKDDVVAAAKGLANLTGITKVYTVVNNALAASFVKVGVGEAAAATGAKAFAAALTATGIGALVVGLGLAISALMEFVSAESQAERATRLLSESIKEQDEMIQLIEAGYSRANQKYLSDLKVRGATEKELREEEVRLLKETQQRAYEQEQKALRLHMDALAKLREDRNDENIKVEQEAYDNYQKRLAANNNAELAVLIKQNENILADRKEAEDKKKKQEEDAAKAREDAYNKEVEANRKKYQLLIDDAKMADKDTTAIEIQKAEALVKIQKKYGKDSFDAAQEAKLKKDQLADKEKSDMIALQKEINDALVNTDQERMDQAIASEQEKFKKLMDNEKTTAEQRIELAKALEENIALIKEEYAKKEADKQKERDAKALNDKMILNQMIIDDERSGYEARLAAIDEKEKLINETVYESEAQKTADLRANANLRTQIELEAYEAKQAINMGYIGLAAQLGSLLQDIAGENKALAITGLVIEKAAAIGQIIASTAVANAQAVAAMPLTLGQPWVTINTISAGLSIASVIASSVKAIKEINAAGAGGDGGGGGAAAGPSPSKFANGGLLTGRRHANGGIMTPMGELEGGEYVVNRAATQSFLPLLESLNSFGMGMQTFQGNLSSGVENQRMMSGQAPVVKAYVVASDMTSQQEANKRISDLARL